MAANITPLQPTLGIDMVILSLWLLGHRNPFHEAPDEQLLCWCCFQRQFGTRKWVLHDFYELRSSALSGPNLWACVAYHFAAESLLLLDVSTWQLLHLQLTWAALAGQLFLWTDLLERWHPMTVPHWKSLSSSVRPFYFQCFSMEITWLCARFYTPFSNGCGWNSRIHEFEGVSRYFCI